MKKEEFIEKAKKVHGDKYVYNLVDYKHSKQKVKIVCKKHGVFEQRPGDHLKGCGCIICGGKFKLNNNLFIKKSRKIHNNKYDYSLVQYINNKIKVKIICPIHGVFEQVPMSHLKGNGCWDCRNEHISEKYRDSLEIFIQKAKKVHGDKYDYSLVEYINNKTNVKIICNKCKKIFKQSPNNHISISNKNGCPRCKISKGEIKIENYLNSHLIKFKQQYKFKNCRGLKNLLPFDFYLPEYNTCIEFDGQQHIKPIKHFGGIRRFKQTILTDQIKNKYCKDNNIDLVRIRDIKLIDKILESQFE